MDLTELSVNRVSNIPPRTVYLCVDGQMSCLEGQWEWDLHSDAVYGSNTMQFPPFLNATKGLVHPEDLIHVKEQLEEGRNRSVPSMTFRLITTYGEIK